MRAREEVGDSNSWGRGSRERIAFDEYQFDILKGLQKIIEKLPFAARKSGPCHAAEFMHYNNMH